MGIRWVTSSGLGEADETGASRSHRSGPADAGRNLELVRNGNNDVRELSTEVDTAVVLLPWDHRRPRTAGGSQSLICPLSGSPRRLREEKGEEPFSLPFGLRSPTSFSPLS